METVYQVYFPSQHEQQGEDLFLEKSGLIASENSGIQPDVMAFELAHDRNDNPFWFLVINRFLQQVSPSLNSLT